MQHLQSKEDLAGRKFGRWTVLYRDDDCVCTQRDGKHMRYLPRWMCKCECGRTALVDEKNLKTGWSLSCGCLRVERARSASTIHGDASLGVIKRLYGIYQNMRSRCLWEQCPEYKYYGGKGVSICEEWLRSYNTFKEWAMAHGYKDDLSIDRIDVNGNYEPCNCRWATMREQRNNTTANRRITYNGKTQTLAQWAEETHINRATIASRLEVGWSVEDALTKPARKMHRSSTK